MMKKYLCLLSALCFIAAAGAIRPAQAGGPLIRTADGRPIRWARSEVKGGPLSANTVDAQGRVVYRVDSGPLGPISNGEAVKMVDRIFGLYNAIPTATIEFVNGGPILDPRTGRAVDINGSNMGMVLSGANPTFQNPIVFDSDGSITGGGGVLGFFGFLNFSQNEEELFEGVVVLNGRAVNAIGKVPFLGVFTHEFGHFAGPLDHSQIYGRIAASGANAPPGFNNDQLYDVFAPFTETVYPFLYDGPRSSKLSTAGFGSSGNFVASLSFDDVVALSSLYPTPGYMPTEANTQFGGISGRVIIKANGIDIPVGGLNVIARRISQGAFPPRPDTEVYPGGRVPLDNDGVPMRPANRPEIDSLVTATSLVSGLVGEDGSFQFVGLPAGDYLISVELIDPDAVGGSRIGQRDPQLEGFIPENYNGSAETNDNSDRPTDFTPVRVTVGAITPGIDIVLNGFGGTLSNSDEAEPNDDKKKAQRISVQQILTGASAESDPFTVKVTFGSNSSAGVHDVYRIDLTEPSSLVVGLNTLNTTADFDLFLFNKKLKKTIPINSSSILGLSAGVTGNELLTSPVLPAGTYYIGVSAFSGASSYKLTVLKQQ